MVARRSKVVVESLTLKGTPYIWGAKGEQMINPEFLLWHRRGATGEHPPHKMSSPGGFAVDCSGAVGLALSRGGAHGHIWDWSTDDYWNKLPAIETPSPGDVALYGGTAPTDVSHIEMVICFVDGNWVVGGASGGDQTTTTLADATRRRAGYKVKESHLYRPDFRGFRSIVPLLG